jgi:hypothetical protein
MPSDRAKQNTCIQLNHSTDALRPGLSDRPRSAGSTRRALATQRRLSRILDEALQRAERERRDVPWRDASDELQGVYEAFRTANEWALGELERRCNRLRVVAYVGWGLFIAATTALGLVVFWSATTILVFGIVTAFIGGLAGLASLADLLLRDEQNSDLQLRADEQTWSNGGT